MYSFDRIYAGLAVAVLYFLSVSASPPLAEAQVAAAPSPSGTSAVAAEVIGTIQIKNERGTASKLRVVITASGRTKKYDVNVKAKSTETIYLPEPVSRANVTCEEIASSGGFMTAYKDQTLKIRVVGLTISWD